MTLFEILLVMALLVVIAGIMTPIMTGTMARAGLDAGSELVRGLLAETRLKAMRSGEPHVFRCENQGNRFQILSLSQLLETGGETLEPAAADDGDDPADLMRLGVRRLPRGVVFAGGDMIQSPQLTTLGVSQAVGSWSPPIVFQPDGTSNDATLLLANERGLTLRVTLRGLTGVALVGEVGEEDLQ